MNQRDVQFLELYQESRYNDQVAYYEARKEEFEGARGQAFLLIIGFMFLACIAAIFTSVFISFNNIGLGKLCASLAVIFPICATVISAYDTLYAFERHVKLYDDVVISLHRAYADKPELKPGLNEVDYCKTVREYVNEVERILRTEQGQWAQLSNEIHSIDPPLPQA